MKKLIKILAAALLVAMVFTLSSCNADNKGEPGENGLSAYELAVQAGYQGTLEEWLESLKGDKDGEKGEDGKTPYIGANGNWWIGNTDLGVSASPDAALPGVTSVTTLGLYPDTGVDVSEKIQSIIDQNPNTTLFFPDGEYLLKNPIKTSAKYSESVSLWLANYAEFKATSDWAGGSNAMIMLGARNPYKDVYQPGSNYFLEGGIINGNGIANGVSIDSGRETRIENVSIKNTFIGLHIKYGANNGSSDADIINVNIAGNKAKGSTGLLIEGFDNTFQNMRITGIQIGVHLKAGGNFLRDIHPLIGGMDLYSGSIGFLLEGGSSFFDVCYPDNFETGFKVTNESSHTFTNCHVYWYYNNGSTPKITKEIGFHFTAKFNSTINNTIVVFKNAENVENAYLKVDRAGGNGSVYNPRIDSKNDNNSYQTYLVPMK